MNQLQDYLLGSIWYREPIVNPYQVISDFFFDADVKTYRKIVKAMMFAASKEEIYAKSSPSELLHNVEMLESLINAAYLINSQDRHSPVQISDQDLFNPDLFRDVNNALSDWANFPRALSLKEYKNPYLAIRRFFEVMELSSWKSALKEILDFALSEYSIYDDDNDIDCLSVYIYLTKLIESAHLIEVREINRIRGSVKITVKTES